MSLMVSPAPTPSAGDDSSHADIRSIINDDETLMIHVQPAMRSHNLAQLHVVEHPAEGDVPAHSVRYQLQVSRVIAYGNSRSCLNPLFYQEAERRDDMPTPSSSGRSLSIMFNWYVLELGQLTE
jgi:hypothetical protein